MAATLQVSAGLVGDIEPLVRLAQAAGSPAYEGPAGTWSARASAKATDDGMRIAGMLDAPNADEVAEQLAHLGS